MMIKFPAYAFLTGLYFSILQFSYLILLQINISSAYLTYMVITASWLTGSIIGLWLENLDRNIGVGLGLFCYYGVYALVSNMPFSSFTLALASVGSGITGLWAGRFFIFVLHQYKQVDRIFFHENNGFWVGIVTFFLGFTLLGRPFIFWAPMTLAGLLFSKHTWIKGENKQPSQ
ncbi:MAG: hypothetical protein HOI59_14340 [Nitrospina sp.]|jgi:hypothetical protein|nr:hypothetical protein [Nitrospina sp.]MBT3416300.1 hypothetical protein [Nitrospina sp.]MBT3856729.1 hypothetical protein [Nitrospina sp.]MBT4105374.1 hypothetical protein [Nitrospina sp.]MBT4390634.1 hypothetical protein [Nitrospina sp.]